MLNRREFLTAAAATPLLATPLLASPVTPKPEPKTALRWSEREFVFHTVFDEHMYGGMGTGEMCYLYGPESNVLQNFLLKMNTPDCCISSSLYHSSSPSLHECLRKSVRFNPVNLPVEVYNHFKGKLMLVGWWLGSPSDRTSKEWVGRIGPNELKGFADLRAVRQYAYEHNKFALVNGRIIGIDPVPKSNIGESYQRFNQLACADFIITTKDTFQMVLQKNRYGPKVTWG